MVKINPFRGVYYDKSKIDPALVITPPYDVISEAERLRYSNLSEHNFVNIILNQDHRRAAALLNQWLAEATLKTDEKECIYSYTQQFSLGTKICTRTACISLLEMEELGKDILPHEKTLPKHLTDRLDLMEHTHSNEGLVFFIYSDPTKLFDSVNERHAGTESIISFRDENSVLHELRRIDDSSTIAAFRDMMKDKKLVVADGHHRYKAALEFMHKHPELGGARFRMGAFVNSYNPGLVILPTNRLLFNHPLPQDFLERLAVYFDLVKVGGKSQLLLAISKANSQNKLGFLDYRRNSSYIMHAKEMTIMESLLPESSKTLRQLPVSLLHKLIFEHVLGLKEQDQAKEIYIEFVKGNEETLTRFETGSYDAAFFISPPNIDDVFRIALNNELMPQKSTFFYPKMFSGLLIYMFGR